MKLVASFPLRTGAVLFCSMTLLAVQSARASIYTLTPVTVDNGGQPGTSAAYSVTTAAEPGGAGTSTTYSARTGYAGQIGEFNYIRILASPYTLNENSTRQLSAELVKEDGIATPLDASSLAWSVVSGPITGISSTGLATAGAVYENTNALVRADSLTDAGTQQFTVINVTQNNFGAYANDGLPDDWQVEHFGLNAPNAGLSADADGDGIPNLLEFAFGTDPKLTSSGPSALQYSGTFAGNGTIVSTGQPTTRVEAVATGVDYRALFVRRKDFASVALTYTPQFSADMITWVNGTGAVTVLADDGVHQIVSIKYPLSVGGKKARFFRINVTTSL